LAILIIKCYQYGAYIDKACSEEASCVITAY
jgi:hypothetical protein